MNYKKSVALMALVPFLGTSIAVQAEEDMMTTSVQVGSSAMAGDFLAEKNVIVDQSSSPDMYMLGGEITRREMLKVMMNISGKTVMDSCTGKFSDLPASDWGCKYAETALAEGFISANASFHPNNNVSEAEALKMIMQGRGIEKGENTDWRMAYEMVALENKVIDAKLDYNMSAKRGWVFETAARTYSDYTRVAQEEEVMPNIVETAVATESLSTLVTAVSTAGLVDALSAPGPFTVFAPTNDAFAKLPEGTVASLLKPESKDALTGILTYHVVAGNYMADDITDGLTLTTLQGETIKFTLVDGKVMINGTSEVILPNVKTSNGTVHVINTVLMPATK